MTSSGELTFERVGDRLRLGGALDLAHARELEQGLSAAADVTGIDLAEVERIDGAGIVVLMGHIDRMEAAGGSISIDGGNERAERLLALYRGRRGPGPEPTPTRGSLATFGAFACQVVRNLIGLATEMGRYTATAVAVIRRPRSVCWSDLPLLIQRAGAEGTGIVILTNLLVGAVMGFMGVVQLQRFGAGAFTPQMVAMGHLRELGPIMTAIIVAGRSGAGFAAELGTMKVSEEVDALRTMGFDPLRWLVVPRVLALVVALPLLTLIGDVVGLIGGGLAAMPFIELPLDAYVDATLAASEFQHFALGILKSFAFAAAIALLACGQGLAARGGASAVGVRTTTAVVLAIFSVVVIDAVFALVTTALGI